MTLRILHDIGVSDWKPVAGRDQRVGSANQMNFVSGHRVELTLDRPFVAIPHPTSPDKLLSTQMTSKHAPAYWSFMQSVRGEVLAGRYVPVAEQIKRRMASVPPRLVLVRDDNRLVRALHSVLGRMSRANGAVHEVPLQRIVVFDDTVMCESSGRLGRESPDNTTRVEWSLTPSLVELFAETDSEVPNVGAFHYCQRLSLTNDGCTLEGATTLNVVGVASEVLPHFGMPLADGAETTLTGAARHLRQVISGGLKLLGLPQRGTSKKADDTVRIDFGNTLSASVTRTVDDYDASEASAEYSIDVNFPMHWDTVPLYRHARAFPWFLPPPVA